MNLSVILPCFNGAETIAVQLEALCRQQWSSDWEVVVVNNGSTDSSMEIVERYRDRLPNLRIVQAHDFSQPRRGVAHSYTSGIQAAASDVFVFCEADDEVGEGWLTQMAEALQQHDFVAGALEYRKLNPDLHDDDDLPVDRALQTAWFMPPDYTYSSGCKLGMKRWIFDAVGGFDEACRTSWDTDFCWRVQQVTGVKLHFVPDAIIHYRLTSFSAMYGKARRWGVCEALLFAKHGPSLPVFRRVTYTIRVFSSVLRDLCRVPLLKSGGQAWAKWLWSLGWNTGRLQGTLRYTLLQQSWQSQASTQRQSQTMSSVQ